MPGVDRIEQVVASARAIWPEVAVTPDQLAAHLRRLGADPEELERRHGTDLYLACACVLGDPAALAVLERQLMPRVARAVARVAAAPAFVDEVCQELRCRLLLGPTPRIAEYAGTGPLGSWLSVAAIRTALNLRRRGPRDVAADLDARAASGAGPEAAWIVQRHKADAERALRDALAALPGADRRLLRLHYVDQLTLEEIGVRHRVNRSTISRRLGAVRARILDEVKRLLVTRLGLGEATLESLVRSVRGDLDVSLSALDA